MEILSIEPLDAATKATRGRPRGAVGRIRQMHHDVARMFAAGMKVTEIARLMSRTPATIRNWLNSPLMAEAVAEYEEEAAVVVKDAMARRQQLVAEASTKAREEIRDRIFDDAERSAMPLSALLKIAADGDDRTGLGKMETRLNIQADIGEQLREARERAEAGGSRASTGKVIEFIPRRA
jgi:hypothetical protein